MKNRFRFMPKAVIFTVFILAISSGSARGAGFALVEQGVGSLGNAYAGNAASAEDATTIFFNPAGLTRLSGQQVIAGAHLIMPSAEFNNEGSTHVLQAMTGVPLLGGNGGDGGAAKLVPNLYYSNKFTDRLAAGIGINAPFSLAGNYDETWVGRYHAIESDLITVNINPSLAYKITDRFSIGAGFNAQYIKAKLSNAIDFGTLDAVGAFKALGLAPAALKLIPQQSDGFVKLEGNHWAFGYNAGLLYEFTQDTRIGAAYRSRMKHTIKGDAEFSNVPPGLSPYPVFKNGGVETTITLPDMLAVSFFHQINPQWAVMADVTWTNWSLLNELRIKFDNPAQADSVTTTNWRDSYRYSLGATYTPDKKWTYRVGVAYDETPIPDEQHRTPRIPDGNRIWTAVGLGYKVSSTVGLDLGYAHLFVSDPKISKTPTGEDLTRGGLTGTYSAHVNIVSAQFTLRF
jgi:long-chain fatty acid transport protein